MFPKLTPEQLQSQGRVIMGFINELEEFAVVSAQLVPAQQTALSNLQKPLSADELREAIDRIKKLK